MANEINAIINYKDASGTVNEIYPITKIDNVEGLESALNGKVSTQSGYGLISDADKSQIQTNKASITAAETAIAGKASAEAVTQLHTDMAVQEARMDQLVGTVPAGSADEIADARVTTEGETKNNLGNAIRSQFSSLREEVNDSTGNLGLVRVETHSGRVNLLQGTSVNPTIETKTGYSYAVITNLKPSDKIYVTAEGPNVAAYRTLGWYKSNGDGTYASVSKDASGHDNQEITVGITRDTLYVNNVDSSKTLKVYIKHKTFEKTINVDDFGAKGDSYTDDTKAIQMAMDYCEPGMTLEFTGNKQYLISEPIVCRKSNVTVDGKGATIKFYNTDNNTGNSSDIRYYGMFTFLGESSTDSVSITSIKKYRTGIVYSGDIETQPYALKLYVTDISKFSVGDTVLITSGNTGANPNHEYKPSFSILCKVTEIHSDNSVYTDYCTPYDFDGINLSNAKITAVSTINRIRVRNINLYDASPFKNTPPDYADRSNRNKVVAGIGFHYGENIDIENVTGLRTKLPLVMVQYGYNVAARNVRLYRPDFLDGGEGYAIHMCGVLYGIAENIYGYSARHVVDFSYSAHCQAKEIRTTSTGVLAGFDLHGICEHNITVENSSVSIQLGNRYNNFACMTDTVRFSNCEISFGSLRGYNNRISFENCNIIAYTSNAYTADGEETLGFNVSDALFDNCTLDVIDINRMYIGTGIYYNPYSITFRDCKIYKNGADDSHAYIHIGDNSHDMKINIENTYINAKGSHICVHGNINNISGEIVDATLRIYNNSVKKYGEASVTRISKLNVLYTDKFDSENPFIIYTNSGRYITFIDEVLLNADTENEITFIGTSGSLEVNANVFADKVISLDNANVDVNLTSTGRITVATSNILTN